MKIDYQNIFKKNILNVLKDVLKHIEKNGIASGHSLYITFLTNDPKVVIPKWLKEKYPEEMTIVIQYEFYKLVVRNNDFSIGLSFDDIKADLRISYDSVISFADPYANFGLKLINKDINKTKTKKHSKNKQINNIIEFKNYKKN